MKEEIQKYKSTSTSPPIIVVDWMCLVYPFCHLDKAGVICGGRYNEISHSMNHFFGELKSLGAELEFFSDGPIRSIATKSWCLRKDSYYQDMINIYDAVDQEEELLTIANIGRMPFHYVCTLKQAAMNHGRHHWATAKQCDQQMVAFANKPNTLAILSDDSDFLIYEGPWRLWCTTSLDIKNLTTIEYNRAGLIQALGLQRSQMPLLATLAGNDVVDSKSLTKFHRSLGNISDKIQNVAKFIKNQQNQKETDIFNWVLKDCPNNKKKKELIRLFKQSLNSYQVTYIPINQKHLNEPIETELLSRQIAFFYQMFHSKNIESSPGVIDLRQQELGEDIPGLKIALMLRMGGIILYHYRQMDYSKCTIMIKLRHQTGHALHHYRVEFPAHMEPPTLQELLSNDPVTCSQLKDTKMQLLCWIVSKSNNLDRSRLEAVPKPLQITVLTLYCLVERQMIKQFEADLLLQIANDVTFSTYDPKAIPYPQKLGNRPFRLAFAYQQIYAFVAKAFNLVGLNASVDEDPPFDGVLFHNRYEDYSRQRVSSSSMDEWKLYESPV